MSISHIRRENDDKGRKGSQDDCNVTGRYTVSPVPYSLPLAGDTRPVQTLNWRMSGATRGKGRLAQSYTRRGAVDTPSQVLTPKPAISAAQRPNDA